MSLMMTFDLRKAKTEHYDDIEKRLKHKKWIKLDIPENTYFHLGDMAKKSALDEIEQIIKDQDRPFYVIAIHDGRGEPVVRHKRKRLTTATLNDDKIEAFIKHGISLDD